MNELDRLIREFEGEDYFEEEPEPYSSPGLLIIGLAIIGWIAFIGAGYAIYRAFETWGAVFG